MNKKIIFEDLGVSEYKKTWDYQNSLLEKVISQKTEKKNNPIVESSNYLLFVEHPHVYTLGKSGNENNLLLNYIQLQAKNATFYHSDRGGDITYHGPGQIVGYPILDLENFEIGLRRYIWQLEESIINSIKEFGIIGGRDERATGVWIDAGKANARKICAIGVKSSRYVTMHGFALNVNTDLSYFSHINPCGFVDKGVTSISKETGTKTDIETVKRIILKNFALVFGAEL
ncbi:MAG: lipoyl(octanoyl) transferase LipB [Prolixibacteraceae bacterium]|nr:lipoyl(octanoyl) transferase LipB [Prolixibacteraceae bacterium]